MVEITIIFRFTEAGSKPDRNRQLFQFNNEQCCTTYTSLCAVFLTSKIVHIILDKFHSYVNAMSIVFNTFCEVLDTLRPTRRRLDPRQGSANICGISLVQIALKRQANGALQMQTYYGRNIPESILKNKL